MSGLEDSSLRWRVSELEKDMETITKKLDRLIWALVTLTITIAGSAVIFALTVLSIGGTN